MMMQGLRMVITLSLLIPCAGARVGLLERGGVPTRRQLKKLTRHRIR